MHILLAIVLTGCGQQAVPQSAGNPLPAARTNLPSSSEPKGSRQSSGRSAVPIMTVSSTATSWTPRGPVRDWQSIVIHHTASETGSVESIHQIHRERKDAAGNPWRGIGYHFVIGNGHGMDDGAIEATFRWREQLEGAHAGISRYNEQGVGICLIGNFEKHSPTEAQIVSLKKLIAWLSQEYDISVDQVKGHRDLKATACPGKFFPMKEFVDLSTVGKSSSPFTSMHARQL
ncbi:MAG: N-acetylmuramoyl-L-alanine amidase [Planctomycetaceae bacterium]|nr:N-acetylmuramoyl-L-alanine amidase [Planctomycetaceae bacterium]